MFSPYIFYKSRSRTKTIAVWIDFSYLSYINQNAMRTAVYSILFSCLLASCNNHKTAESSAVVQSKTLVTLPSPPEQLKGTYIGDFKGSPIAITLNYVSGTHASGYNVHKGLTRNISGTIEPASSGFLRLQLSEPGNNQYDGKFDLLVDTAKLVGKGTWTPFKKRRADRFFI